MSQFIKMKSQRSWSFGGVVALCAFTVVVVVSVAAFLNSTVQQTTVSVGLTSRPNSQSVKRHAAEATVAKTHESLNDTAYVFLGLGATAHQLNCPASIESLVRYGGWSGKIFLITDQGNCFDDDLIIRNAGMEKQNFQKIVVKEDFGGGGIDLWNPKVGFSKNRLRSKSMKTQLFEIIKDPSIQVLAYVDCDILFGVEGCPAQFVQAGAPWEQNKIKFSRIGTDADGKLTNIHTGTIVMHREHSKEVLQRWYDRLSSGVDDMDRTSFLMEYAAVQDALDRRANETRHISAEHTSTTPINTAHSLPQPPTQSLTQSLSESASQSQPEGMQKSQESDQEQGQNTRSLRGLTTSAAQRTAMAALQPHISLDPSVTTNVMMPSELVYYNATGYKHHYEIFVDPALETLPCMVHVSKARCEGIGRVNVQGFVDRYNLRTYNQGYMYCPNPTVAPVLYGWFPLSYLPFCPKIEIFG